MPEWLRIVLVVAALLAAILLVLWERRGRMPLWLLFVLIVLLLLLVYLFGPVGARLLAPLSERAAWEAAPTWLTCIDCRSGELDALMTQVDKKPEATLHYLSDALLHGPGAAKTEDLGHTLARLYQRDSAYVAQHYQAQHLAPRAEYVADFQSRFERTWRIRAALGLGRIAALYPSLGSVTGGKARVALSIADTAVADSSVHRAVVQAGDTAFVKDSLPH